MSVPPKRESVCSILISITSFSLLSFENVICLIFPFQVVSTVSSQRPFRMTTDFTRKKEERERERESGEISSFLSHNMPKINI